MLKKMTALEKGANLPVTNKFSLCEGFVKLISLEHTLKSKDEKLNELNKELNNIQEFEEVGKWNEFNEIWKTKLEVIQ